MAKIFSSSRLPTILNELLEWLLVFCRLPRQFATHPEIMDSGVWNYHFVQVSAFLPSVMGWGGCRTHSQLLSDVLPLQRERSSWPRRASTMLANSHTFQFKFVSTDLNERTFKMHFLSYTSHISCAQ